MEGLEKLDRYAGHFVRRAIDISRFNAGKFRLNPANVNLSLLLRSVTESHALIAQYANCPLELKIQDGIVGVWDRVVVEEIADNLLSNAIKYWAGKTVELCLVSDDTTAVLSVRDHGPGLFEDDQARIFGKFERLFRGDEASGFGVALWVVRKLVNAMNGKIIVSSRMREGATFTVILPLQKTKARRMSDERPDEEPRPERVPSGIAGLDTILHGGFLKGGIYLIQGEPGAAKTIAGNQLCYAHVAKERRFTSRFWPKAMPAC